MKITYSQNWFYRKPSWEARLVGCGTSTPKRPILTFLRKNSARISNEKWNYSLQCGHIDRTGNKKYYRATFAHFIVGFSSNIIVSGSFFNYVEETSGKVEEFLKGSLDLDPITFTFSENLIMSRKVCLRCEGKTLLGIVNKHLKTKSLLTSPRNVLPLVNFPANNLNFHWRWRWWDQIKATFLNPFYFNVVA